MYAAALGVALGTTAANFLYQAVGAGNWSVAFDRSFFQIIAILMVVGLCAWRSSQPLI